MTKKTTGRRAAPKANASGSPGKPSAGDLKRQEVNIAAAKGRPMLTWVGKRALRRVTAFPAQSVETFNPLGQTSGWQNLLFHGDNKDVLAWLLANGFRGKVNLIYIDPPFDSGADYVRKVQLRGVAGITKIDGETYTLGEQIQYTDIWTNDNYLQFMYERLLLLKELLGEDGSIYVHCDPRRGHHLRCLLDEVFGADHFRGEVIWKRADAHSTADRYGPIHDNILYYARGDTPKWNPIRTGVTEETADTWYSNEEVVTEETIIRRGDRPPVGSIRRFNKADVSAPGSREGTRAHYEWKGHFPPPGRHWAYMKEEMERLDKESRLVYSSSGKPYEKRYLDEAEGAPLQSLWTDIQQLRGMQLTSKTAFYPTEKPEELLDRILRASSDPNGLVLDCYIGSGTTAAVAQKLGRRWIGCDINRGAIQTTAKRLQTIIREQIEAERQGKLLETEGEGPPKPAALAFSVYRVNDYDLAIQHNEAVNLACEHLGVLRKRTDSYFDGTLGKRLVKIIPFGHPLTPLDLHELEKELKSRPKEDRQVVVVCLGKEPAADAWLEQWNRHRPVNKIEVIELRTDKKYGKFFTHQPARARVEIKRVKGKIVVEIKNFISPTIIERLNMDQNIFRAQVTDWRAMVDSVMIDTAYDGQTLNVALSDVPERKTDLVAGRYELPAPKGPATVAVKITDMLGEEVLITTKLG